MAVRVVERRVEAREEAVQGGRETLVADVKLLVEVGELDRKSVV